MIREFLVKMDLPKWANWYAVDNDGNICVYSEKPVRFHNCWGGGSSHGHVRYIMWIDPESIPNFDWTKTLHMI